jgi:hypothetical protein
MMADPSPYVGPEPFQAGQTIFGRSKEISELYYRLLSERIILFYSPSGAGKSSLIQAGLIPRLWEHFDTWRPTRVSTAPPGHLADRCNRFAYSVMLGLEEGLPPELRRPVEDFATLPLIEYVRNKPRHPEAPSNIFLFIDQFEEVLTNDPSNLKAKEEFFTQLGELLLTPDIWAILAIREDFLAALDPYASFIPTHMKNRFRLDRLSREAAMEAIEGPTLDPIKTNRQYMPGTVATLASNLAKVKVQTPDGDFQEQIGNYVEPVQLQVVCEELWGGMDKDDLTIDPVDVDKHGNVSAALSNYYEHKLEEIVDKDFSLERKIREWIDTYLITSLGLRNQVIRGKGHTQGLDNTLVEKLIKCHLVRPEVRGNSTWYELSHDRLINPIRNRNLIWYENHLQRFQKAAALWKKQDERNDALLLTGKALAEALQWEANNSVEPLEEEFLRKSKARQRQLDLEEKLRQEEREKAERASRHAWFYGICCAVALLFGIYTWTLYRKAEESTLQARENLRMLFLEKARLALGEIEATDSAMAYQEAWIHHLAAMTMATKSNPEVGGRLMQQDLQPGFTPSGKQDNRAPQAVFKATYVPATNHLLLIGKPQDGGFSEVSCLESAWNDCNFVPSELKRNIRALAFSPDARTLLIRNREGQFTWRKLGEWEKNDLKFHGPPTLNPLDHGAAAVNTKWAALGAASGRLRLYPMDQKTISIPRKDLPIKFNRITALAFKSADDDTLAVASEGEIKILRSDPAGWKEISKVATLGKSDSNALSFWPDSKLLISGHSDGYIRVWDLDAPADPLVAALRLHDQAILALSIDPKGDFLWTVSSDGLQKQTSLKPQIFGEKWEIKALLARNGSKLVSALYERSCQQLGYTLTDDGPRAGDTASFRALEFFNRGASVYVDGKTAGPFSPRSKYAQYLADPYPIIDPANNEMLLMPDKLQDAHSAFFVNANIRDAFKVEFDYRIENKKYGSGREKDPYRVGNGFALQFFREVNQKLQKEKNYFTSLGSPGYSLNFNVYPLDEKSEMLTLRDLEEEVARILLAEKPISGVYTGASWKHVCVLANPSPLVDLCAPQKGNFQGVRVYFGEELKLEYSGALRPAAGGLAFVASSGDATSEKRIKDLVITEANGTQRRPLTVATNTNSTFWKWTPELKQKLQVRDIDHPYPKVQNDQIILTPDEQIWRANLVVLHEPGDKVRHDFSIEFEYSIHNADSSDPSATGQGLVFLFGKDLSQFKQDAPEEELTDFLPSSGCALHFNVHQVRSIALRGPCLEAPKEANLRQGLPDLVTGGPGSKEEWRKVRVLVETSYQRVRVFYEGAPVIDARVKLHQAHHGIAFGVPAALQLKNEAKAKHAIRNIIIRDLKSN